MPRHRKPDPGRRELLKTAGGVALLSVLPLTVEAVAADAKPSDPKAGAPTAGNDPGGYNTFWIDPGTKVGRIKGQLRSSWLVDPADGKLPYTAEGKAAFAKQLNYVRSTFDGPDSRPLGELCILGFGSTAGPPMLPVLYNNNYQIVQTPDAVMIMVEMVHDVRVIRMNQKHVPPDVRKWLGDSVGHWEGDTLVVDTTNFNPHVQFSGSSENLHIIERFRRVDADTILYRATIDDPSTFTKIWTLEYPFRSAAGPVYEYACHEGNYAMSDIMGGARKAESNNK